MLCKMNKVIYCKLEHMYIAEHVTLRMILQILGVSMVQSDRLIGTNVDLDTNVSLQMFQETETKL